MSSDLEPVHSFTDLGNAWLHEHTARIRLRHLQFERHFRFEAASLLSRAAWSIRIQVKRQQARGNSMRRAMIDAIEHCLRLDAAGRMTAPNARVR